MRQEASFGFQEDSLAACAAEKLSLHRSYCPLTRKPPGSHFLGCAHTQANFEAAFWRSIVADNNSFEQWRDDGERDAARRANATWKRQLHEYEAPALDAGHDEALNDYMARRKAVLPDSIT